MDKIKNNNQINSIIQIANQASENASIAAKVASESATAIAVLGTDVTWMKKSLGGIEETLNEMSKAFVTAVQHQEVLKRIDDHEIRLNVLETNNTRTTVLLSIGIGLITLLTSLLIYHIIGK